MNSRSWAAIRGPAARAVHASAAIPGVFVPVTVDGRILVDGGVTNPVPADVARRLGADIVIMLHPDYQYTPKLITAMAAMIAYGEFDAVLDWISPIASLNFRGFGGSNEKTFPARATLKRVDPRLRPGMSATGIVLIESPHKAALRPYHRQKLALVLANQRHFALEQAQG